ncbi:MAG: hypothetical protein FWD04_08005 [Conexibacteraceae bacterium]|nr:hypothetical protein [Conexibacteraceae bacterium]
MNVYLPDDPADRAKLAGVSLSAITQDALRNALAAPDTGAWLDRLDQHASAEFERDRVLDALDQARENFGARSRG